LIARLGEEIMKIRSYNLSPNAEINVIPLLDVVFSILAFFILLTAGLTQPSSIGVDLPQTNRNSTSNSGNPTQPDMLVITLDRSGATRIDRQPLPQAALEQRIKSYLVQYPQGIVVLNAEDNSVSYQQVIVFLEYLRGLAGDRVAIATSKS
jgi:biopolymer transport protein ExbD